jgi:hypothetical protein
MLHRDILDRLNASRRQNGLLTVDEMVESVCSSNTVFDPFSVLIARSAILGTGNILFPGVVLLCNGGTIRIGSNNRLHMQTTIAAENGGQITIGDSNDFGEGGFVARANRASACIEIGSNGRYVHGAAVYGSTKLGSGSQILGKITVDGCILAAGSDHSAPDVDRRGGVLKGHGTAKGLVIKMGEVLVGAGRFDQERTERQSVHHPRSQ